VHDGTVVPPAVKAPLPIIPPHETVHVAPTLERMLHEPASLFSAPQMQAGTPWSGPTSQQLPLPDDPDEQAIAVTQATSPTQTTHWSFTTSTVPKARTAVSTRVSGWLAHLRDGDPLWLSRTVLALPWARRDR
jgi:hypothetical protein